MILNEIMCLANKGIVVSYEVIDQIENGHKQLDPAIPLKTYTVYITPKSSCHDSVDCQNFDDLKIGLEWGIKEAKKYLKVKDNV